MLVINGFHMPQDIWALCVIWKCGQISSSAPMLGMTEWPGTLQSRRGVLGVMWAGSTLAWEAQGSCCSMTPPKQEGKYQQSWWGQMWNKEKVVVLRVAEFSWGLPCHRVVWIWNIYMCWKTEQICGKVVCWGLLNRKKSCWRSPQAANGWRLGDYRKRGCKDYQLCLPCFIFFPWPMLLATGDDR